MGLNNYLQHWYIRYLQVTCFIGKWKLPFQCIEYSVYKAVLFLFVKLCLTLFFAVFFLNIWIFISRRQLKYRCMEILRCLSKNRLYTTMLKSTFVQFLHYLDNTGSRCDRSFLPLNIVNNLTNVRFIFKTILIRYYSRIFKSQSYVANYGSVIIIKSCSS